MTSGKKNGYTSIPAIAGDEGRTSSSSPSLRHLSSLPEEDARCWHCPQETSQKRLWIVVSCALAGLLLILFVKIRDIDYDLTLAQHDNPAYQQHHNALPMPHGVNLASWLSLEDYFFVGHNGAKEVATPTDGRKAAQCLPPLVPSTKWNSETDLFATLVKERSVREAILAFGAFRNSYVDLDKDLQQIAGLGITTIRVPVSWCLTHWDPTNETLLDDTSDDAQIDDKVDNRLLERYTCGDPYYKQHEGLDVRWPAVPKALIIRLLRHCHRYGIRAVLDVHTYPGGTSLGTFGGVWPRPPLFWQYDKPEDPDNDIGRRLFRDLLDWLESLSETDPGAFAGLGGITPMNEPGHLAGLFGPGSSNPNTHSFVPNLPRALADAYLQELTATGSKHGKKKNKSKDLVQVPDGPHLRVLKWQRDALQAFRATSLPRKGIQLIVNLHESILVSGLTPIDNDDAGGRHPAATEILAAWWRGTTTEGERQAWAALDMHHYHAWEPNCQGTVAGHGGAYVCGDTNATDNALQQCSSWAQLYRNAFQEQLDDSDATAKLVSGEFSSSTHHSVLTSCMDVETLHKSYTTQVQAAQRAQVNLFYWSWKMPYGGSFRSAWSFSHLLYLLQHDGFTQPDESVLPCGH